MAAQGGVRPSAVIGIDCEWCAYCLDDALVFRQWMETHHQIEKAEQERAMEAHIANARKLQKQGGLRSG